ncbi:tetratricopeptide repeat protein [Lacticaseibacillus zhaodongensis]|uniref:tetratricopeptide repeat protein n=1 Tax=Lacticaseibacillus zhaodongensis TaxID=2668065 RepID=UPI0012D3133F|nr:tetratricopeptide repeat protein [Lacticaseibacillus zhaodongensis]
MSYSEQMLDAVEKGNMDQAKVLFQKVLANDDDETKFSLAEQLYALGFTGQAKRIYQELSTKYPDEASVLTALADIAVSDGDSDTALNYLNRIEPDNPDYVQALLEMADVYQTQGLYEVSENKLLTAQKLAPDEPVITFALGELEFAWGHFEQAAAAYLDLIEAGEDTVADVNVHLRYAESLANNGRYEDAVAVYEEYGTGELPLADRFQLGALYYQLKDYQKSVDMLKQVVEQDASYTNAYLPLANAERETGAMEEALKTVQNGIAQDETNDELYSVGAQLALDLDDQELGEKYLQKAMRIAPDNEHHKLAWSNFLLQAGRDEENIDFLQDLDADGNGDPQLYWNLARSQERSDDYDNARGNYLLAFRTFQDRPEFLRDLARFFRTTAAHAEEQSALTRLLQIEPDDLDAQDRLDALKNGEY